MKTFLFLLLNASSVLLFAQQASYDKSDMDKLKATTTCVVLYADDEEYNRGIQEAIEAEWKVTPYRFISMSEFDAMQFDQDKSFLIKMSVTFGDNTGYYLALVLGHKEKAVKGYIPDINRAPKIASVQMDFERAGSAHNAFLRLLIRNIHRHIEDVADGTITSYSGAQDLYNARTAEIKKKTLMVIADDLTPDLRKNPASIKTVYPNKVKVVTEEELNAAILEGEDAFLAYHTSLGDFGYHQVFNISDGKTVFYTFKPNYHNNPEQRKYSEKDFKAFAKAK